MMNRCMCSQNRQNQMMNPYGRSMQQPEMRRPPHKNSCGCGQENAKPMPRMEKAEPGHRETCAERPTRSRAQLLQHINEVSFAVNDILLYLDTHPCDQKAIEYYEENVKKRKEALCEFAKYYGPLTVDTANEAQNDSWEWVMQPWPWEGGKF